MRCGSIAVKGKRVRGVQLTLFADAAVVVVENVEELVLSQFHKQSQAMQQAGAIP